MDDPITTADVLLQLGTAAVGGMFGAGIALLTVWLTQSGDQKAAKLAEAGARRAAQLQEARHAAEQVQRAANELMHRILERQDSYSSVKFYKWSLEVALYSAVIAPVNFELSTRIQHVHEEWMKFDAFLSQYPHLSISTSEHVAAVRALYGQVGAHNTWLMLNLSMFRANTPLPEISNRPAPIKIPDLPRKASIKND